MNNLWRTSAVLTLIALIAFALATLLVPGLGYFYGFGLLFWAVVMFGAGFEFARWLYRKHPGWENCAYLAAVFPALFSTVFDGRPWIVVPIAWVSFYVWGVFLGLKLLR